jgi:hypothetical protein
MQLFAKALVVLAGGHHQVPYPEALHCLLTNVSEAVRPQIYRWNTGVSPDWTEILKHTEAQFGQQKMHEIFAEVGLRKPVANKSSPFRTALVARLTPDQRRLLVHDDIELGRRLLNNMCTYWGVPRPKNFVHDQKFLESYLNQCELLSRLPWQLADLLALFMRCKPSDRNWEQFFKLLNDNCSESVWLMVQERSGDQYRFEERLMEQVEREQQLQLLEHFNKASRKMPLMPPDLQFQYYTRLDGRVAVDTETYATYSSREQAAAAAYAAAALPKPPTNTPTGRIVDDKTNRHTTHRTHLALDIELLTRHPILQPGTADPLLATVSGGRLLVQGDDLGVVGHDGSVLDGRHDEGDVHSRVVMLT